MSVDLERQLREFWIETSADLPELDAEDIVLRTFGGTDEANQVALIPAIHRRRGWLVAAAVATVVLAVGLIAVILNPGNELAPVGTPDSVPPEPVVTVPDSAPPEMVPFDSVEWPGLTEDIPEGVESGTLTTPLGTARWVHLGSDEFALPGLGWLKIYTDDGFIVSDLPSGFWQSEDGITWRWEESLNIKPSLLDHADQNFQFVDGDDQEVVPWVPYVDGSYARYWFISTDPLEIETSEGGRGFEVDLSGLVPPDSDGFAWNLDVSQPLTRYTNSGTQSVLHVGFVSPDGQVDQRLLVIDDDLATYLEMPWDVHSNVTLYGTSETLFAYVDDPSSNQISVWRSNDGYRWTESGPLHTQLGAPSFLDFKLTVLPALQTPGSGDTPVRNQMVVVTTPDTGWESVNGIDWTPVPEGLPDRTHPVRLESGWFTTDGDVWWMHIGDTWVSLAELGMERTGDGCQIIPRASGQTTLFFAESTCTPDGSQGFPTDLWVISLDSLR